MRPNKLTMQAFGPYSGIEEIDFLELKERNLFLITGPTGSGKTTIFDAISYAMYGESSGNVRTGESLRSQFALDTVMTEVALEFELKGLTYRVKRAPTQWKPKRSGQGFTEKKASAELEIEGEAKPIVGIRNVNNKIESVMGINAEQFRQIMMIPQGEFRKLLLADSEDREKVLQKLFDTKLYHTVQTHLDMIAKDLWREIRSKTELRDHEIRKIDAGDHEELKALLENGSNRVDEIIRGTEERIAADTETIKKMGQEIEKKEALADKRIQAREVAKQNNEKFDEMERLLVEIAAMKAGTVTINGLQNNLDAAEKAGIIKAQEETYLQKGKELKIKEVAVKRNQVALKQAEESLLAAQGKWESASSKAAEEEREKSFEEWKRVESYIDKVKRIEAETRILEARKKACEKAKNDLEKLNEKLENHQRELAATIKQKEEAQEAKIQLLELQNQMRILIEENKIISDYFDLKKKETKHDEKLKRVQERYKKQELACKDANADLKQMKLIFYRNQAALLARELGQGDPCPVCGSTEHPSLACFSGELVTEEELQKTESAFKEQDEMRTKTGTELAVLINGQEENQKERRGQEKRLIELVDAEIAKRDIQEREKAYGKRLENNQTQLQELGASKDKQEETLKQSGKLEGQIQVLTEAIRVEGETVKNLEAQAGADEEKRLLVAAVLDELLRDVPEAVRSMAALTARIRKCQISHEALVQTYQMAQKNFATNQNALIAIQTSQTHLESEEKSLIKQVEASEISFREKREKAGFDTLEAYELAKRKKEEINQIRSQIESYKKELYALTESQNRIQLEMKDKMRLSIDTFDEEIIALKQAYQTLSDQRVRIQKSKEDNQSILKEVKAATAAVKIKSKRYELLGNLARVAQGQNPARVTFERYVLAAFLEDILEAANIRLNQMSQNRYQLYRTDEKERKNKQSGLELEVFDQYTGKARHVKTLSGGESFKASLSMALGLSDVVQSYAGGVRLDTMFIDEGFGTLDQESLESAINCLIDLQKTGRLIGIISHVQELKERIDVRLEVSSGYTGSATRFVV